MRPAIISSLTERTSFNIGLQYYLTATPIYNNRFGLVVLAPQPQLTQIIQKIAPYSGAAILAAILLSWLILKVWKNRTLKKINHSQSRYKQLVESSMDWIWETDKHGNLTYSSDQCFNMLGYMPQEMIGKPIFKFFLANKAKQNEHNILSHMKVGTDINNLEVHYQSKNSNPVMILMNGKVYRDQRNKIMGYRGINRDITQQKQRHDNIISMAYFDSLTKLPNRANLIDRLNKHLAEVVQRSDMTLSALLFIDLDGFKEVNDFQGHDVLVNSHRTLFLKNFHTLLVTYHH